MAECDRTRILDDVGDLCDLIDEIARLYRSRAEGAAQAQSKSAAKSPQSIMISANTSPAPPTPVAASVTLRPKWPVIFGRMH